MRVLEIETFGRGGLVHYAYNLTAALAERGHDVTLLTHAAYELADRPLPANARVVTSIGRLSARTDSRLPGFAARFVRRVEAVYDAVATAARARRASPDVVHLHCTNSIAWLYVALLRRLRSALVVTAHVVTPHEPSPRLVRLFAAIHRSSPAIVAHSRVDRDRLVEEMGIEPARIAVIPHGEYGFFERTSQPPARDEAREGLGLGPEDEVALFFGYIREYKGLDVLLEAWREVAKARPLARLVVAGDPVRLGADRRDELARTAESLGVIHRLGYVPFEDVAGYFSAADVLVMPYRRISQSGVLFLALSMSVPVVATRVGAIPEVLEDGESALLVAPESAEELAAALRRVLGDAPLRSRLSRAGRLVAEAHSWDTIAEATERCFLRAAAGEPLNP